MIKGKEIKYMTTGPFGDLAEGTVINALLITYDSDSSRGLVYHPKVRGECASIEFAYKTETKEHGYVWVAASEDMYVNINANDFEKNLLGGNFKWTRKVYPSKLQRLIDEYETAILKYDVRRIKSLALRVEKEADRIGYTNHKRLMALHTAAEREFGVDLSPYLG